MEKFKFKRLDAELRYKGFTQRDVAKMLGIAETSYRAKMRGIRQFNLSEIKILIKITEWVGSFDELFEES